MAASESDVAMRTIARRKVDSLGLAEERPAETQHWLRLAEAKVELHVLNHEWYFTSKSALDVAGLFNANEDVICLGAPTVAAQLARLGRPMKLVDTNHLNRLRFPELDSSGTVIWGDVARVLQMSTASAVVFDAPWYFPDVARWLAIANSICMDGGQIAFALFPNWIRSSAPRERDRILDLAATIGTVELASDRLVYTTPRFEAEALLAAGVPPAAAWRKADLVVITKTKRSNDCPLTPPEAGVHWETFLVGTQVVKLRKRPVFRPATELAAIPGCPGDVLPSVSQRDPRRRLVGVWTSRNRVASVANSKDVRRALVRLTAYQRTGKRSKRSARYIDARLQELLELD
jgi:hypothetical protein